MIVVDAAVLTNAPTDDGQVGARARTELGQRPPCRPEHIVGEEQRFFALRSARVGTLEVIRPARITSRELIPAHCQIEESHD